MPPVESCSNWSLVENSMKMLALWSFDILNFPSCFQLPRLSLSKIPSFFERWKFVPHIRLFSLVLIIKSYWQIIILNKVLNESKVYYFWFNFKWLKLAIDLFYCRLYSNISRSLYCHTSHGYSGYCSNSSWSSK